MKSKTLAYLLWFFLGGLSIHRFYLGKVGTGILYLLTGQLFLIGWIIDFFILSGMVDRYNLMHGFIGPNRQANQIVQNVVVNVPQAAYAPPAIASTPPPPSINESPIENNTDYNENDIV